MGKEQFPSGEQLESGEDLNRGPESPEAVIAVLMNKYEQWKTNENHLLERSLSALGIDFAKLKAMGKAAKELLLGDDDELPPPVRFAY